MTCADLFTWTLPPTEGGADQNVPSRQGSIPAITQSQFTVGVCEVLAEYDQRLQAHLHKLWDGFQDEMRAQEARFERCVDRALRDGHGSPKSTRFPTVPESVEVASSRRSPEVANPFPTLLGSGFSQASCDTVACAESASAEITDTVIEPERKPLDGIGCSSVLGATQSHALLRSVPPMRVLSPLESLESRRTAITAALVANAMADDSRNFGRHVKVSELSNGSSPVVRKSSRKSTADMVASDVRHHWRRMIDKGPRKSRNNPLLGAEERSLANILVHSYPYEMFSLTLVLSNAGFIGWNVQHVAVHHGDLKFKFFTEMVFTVLFTMDLAFRLFAERSSFFIGEWRCWNLFDLSVVTVMLLELIIQTLIERGDSMISRLSIVRVLRLIRVVRLIRVIRVLKFFRELRMMIYSVLCSLKSFVWVVLLQSMLFYVVGITMTQGATNHFEANESRSSMETTALYEYFGTLDRSFLSLFEAMAGGISWGELVDALDPLDGFYTGVFLVFIAFAVFALVNIVTGIFVDSALQSSQSDRDLLIQEQLYAKEEYLRSIQQVFEEIDTNASGYISLDEFRRAIADERIVAYLNALELDITDVADIFALLDCDESGEISIDEFVIGCLRLRGSAKTLDIAKLMQENTHLVHTVNNLISVFNRRAGSSLSTMNSISSLSPAKRSSRPVSIGSIDGSLGLAERHSGG